MSSSQDIVQQYINGQVVPADLVGQDAATKTYVNDQLTQRDTAISGAAAAASNAQTDIDAHKADNTVHVQPSEKASYNAHIADGNIHVTPTDKTNWNSKAPGSTQTDLVTHTGNADIHTTLADKNKLAGIASGAEVNQSAFSYVNDVSATAKTDTLFIVGGIGITVSTDPATKKVTITATGSATPGAHASTHVTGGSDVIPNAVTNGASGLMSGADAQFVRVNGETKTGAQAKADAVQTNLNTHTSDSVAHITSAERTTWNAKETTSGAQAKADAVQTNLTTHINASDPHPQYILDTEKGALNGVATLDSSGKIPVAQVPSAGGFEKLADITLASDQAVGSMLTITGLTNYRIIKIIFNARTNTTSQDSLSLRFNSDSTTKYAASSLINGTVSNEMSQAQLRIQGVVTPSTYMHGTGEIEVLNDATKTKGIIGFSSNTGASAANAPSITQTQGAYYGTGAISDLSIFTLNYPIQSGSRFTVYGLK